MLTEKKLKSSTRSLLLIFSGIALFSLSFPGLLSSNGLPFCSFLAVLPVYYSISKMNYREAIFFGFLYGSGSYLLFNYWLAKFDPVSFSIAPSIIGLYNVLLFLLCRFIFNNFSRYAYIPLTLSWFAYEIFKGENIIGYTYGTIAHTMYRSHFFTGIADITGTYTISILIIFPSIFVVSAMHTGLSNLRKRDFFIPLLLYFGIVTLSIIYTRVNSVDYTYSKTLKTSLIQHNMDCWLNGTDELYTESLDDLLDLSKQALQNNPKLVIWSETAFVPAIEWHKKYKTNSTRLDLVNRMEDFFWNNDKTSYLIGANETIGQFNSKQKKYNSVYHYKNGLPVNKYRKIKLVPFTEFFPYPDIFPLLYKHTLKLGAKHYLPGNIKINFNIDGLNITPLICYEDTFSGLARSGVLGGGDMLVNFTNDAWSSEEACSMQHLSAAVFRSIENRRTLIRVGTSGYSCVIDPNGEIIASLPVLKKSHLTFDVPIYNSDLTFYTRYGNIVEILLLAVFGLLILFKLIKSTLPVPLAVMKQK